MQHTHRMRVLQESGAASTSYRKEPYDEAYAEAFMSVVSKFVVVLTAPAGAARPTERWMLPQLLAALQCHSVRYLPALHLVLRSLDLLLEISHTASSYFTEVGGPMTLLRFSMAVLEDAEEGLKSVPEGVSEGVQEGVVDHFADRETVPALHRVAIRVRLLTALLVDSQRKFWFHSDSLCMVVYGTFFLSEVSRARCRQSAAPVFLRPLAVFSNPHRFAIKTTASTTSRACCGCAHLMSSKQTACFSFSLCALA
jgi:hypothetical protein